MNISGVTFNWFDLAVVVVIGIGFVRGRSRGMSLELLDVMKWLIIVALGGIVYQPLGAMISDFTRMSLPFSYVLVYFAVMIGVRFLFGWMKRLVGEKLVGSDAFGSGEYYLGMLAGGVRFACYLVVAMALLNSIYVSPEELAAQARMQQENFGDISFPTIGSMQQTVFTRSVSGKMVKTYLGHELIAATAADKKAAQDDSWGRQRERVVYEALGEKK